MTRLRRISAFALVGATGLPVNAATMWLLHGAGVDYRVAAVLATQVAIATNLLLTEAFVFRDRRTHLRLGHRAGRYFAINNVDTLVRIPLLALMVEGMGMRPSPANLLLVALASGAKYVLVSRVVYRPTEPPRDGATVDARGPGTGSRPEVLLRSEDIPATPTRSPGGS